MHMAERLRDSAITHDDGDRMQSLRKGRPEIPVIVCASHAGSRISFNRMVQIRKLQRIAKEEDRSIVAHQVPVALVCVELQRESANVSLGVRGATLAGDG